MKRGLFITVEGIDGSGKSSVCKRLEEELDNATATYEPSKLWTGEVVEKSVAGEVPHLTTFHHFLADGHYHDKYVIEPLLKEGQTVVCDRHRDSTRAYQGVLLEDSVEGDTLEYIDAVISPVSRVPDLTLYLDIDLRTSAERRTDGRLEEYEKDAFLADVHKMYERIIDEDGRWVRVDATRSLDSVVSECVEIIDENCTKTTRNVKI